MKLTLATAGTLLLRRVKLGRRVRATGLEHDLTQADYTYRTLNGGQAGHIACWNNLHPLVGDWLILRNPRGQGGSSRYRVVSVNDCPGVDPPTMWMADLVFDPRVHGRG